MRATTRVVRDSSTPERSDCSGYARRFMAYTGRYRQLLRCLADTCRTVFRAKDVHERLTLPKPLHAFFNHAQG